MLLPFLIMLLFFAAAAGIVYPYYSRWGRKHFAWVAAGTFVALAIAVPKLTPEERAARKAAEAKEEQAEAAAEALKASQEVAAEAQEDHRQVVGKAAPAIQAVAKYTRAEYGQTFARVGAATFAKLNALEPGAAYAAAESKSCNRADFAAVSDVSKPGAAVWFVDCENGNRFMIGQKDAEAALGRFKASKLALRDLKPSCTATTVAMCKATVAQKASGAKEIEYVTACDLILQQVVASPSSLDMKSWRFGFGSGDKVVIQRPFDAQNAFGAMVRAQYRCEIDARTNGITGFSVSGPTGTTKVI